MASSTPQWEVPKEIQLFMNGKQRPATGGKKFKNLNPATNQVLCEVHQASEADVAEAVKHAEKAFQSWSSLSGGERGKILVVAAQKLRERVKELAYFESLDSGKPLQEALECDIFSAADCIEYYAGVAHTLHGTQHQLSGGNFGYTIREPLGVCLGIGAWNYPLQIAAWKSAPALACGNTFIFKPSEMTPMTAMMLAEIYTDAGVPPGVFNVIQGDREVGQWLVSHPDVAKVSLTGEVGTGKKVMEQCAKELKKVTLELGGKSALIIMKDANMDNAISATMMANFYTMGEVCSNATRVFVHHQIFDHFTSLLKERVGKLVVGDPLDPQTTQGALISKQHTEKVLSYINIGKEEGAKVLIGGGRAKVEDKKGERVGGLTFSSGNFVQPTVFVDCHDEMRIVKEEIFGPVVCLLKFSEEEEVIKRANDTPFCLAAGVFTNDLRTAHRVIKHLKAGTCWINNYNVTPIELPFGGYKQSGIGRENSLITVEHYTQLKSVFVELGDVQSRI